MNSQKKCRYRVRGIARAALFTALSAAAGLTPLHAQSKCETAVADATTLYESGRFAQAILLLNRCLPDSLEEIQRVAAYRLLTLAYLEEDYQPEAKVAVEQLIDHDPYYEPDVLQDPQRYRDLVAEVRVYKPIPQPKGRSPWLWIAGGGAIAAGVAVYFATQGSAEQPLPVPPALP